MAETVGYSYLRRSSVSADGLVLRTSGGAGGLANARPQFFSGFVTTPRDAALGMLAVAKVARARYFQPTARVASLDPVVTGSRDRIRFESFSGCGGVDARMDILPEGLDGETMEHGTTNVDVNTPLRRALARVGGLDPLGFDIGDDEKAVSTMDGSIVEKKVPLPTRWLRGFAEVAITSSGFEPRMEASAADAAAFGQRLPSEARTLRVYGPAVTPRSGAVASVWEVELPTVRLTITLSPEPRRGFSGEGAVLDALGVDYAWVDLGGTRHQVGFAAGRAVSCTCAWWSQHRGDRGPCKHALAVDIVRPEA